MKTLAAVLLAAVTLSLTQGCGSAASEAAAQSAADTPAAQSAGSAAAGAIQVTVVNNSGDDLDTVVVYGHGLGKDLGYQTMHDGERTTLRHDDLRAVPKLNLDYTNYRGQRIYNAITMPRQFTDGYSGNITLTITRSGKVLVSR